jgi:two-component system sensor histidine kinase/response regulator
MDTEMDREKASIAYLCHELRTPVSAIIGISNLLAGQKCSSQRHMECVDILRSTSGMLSALLYGMLDYFKAGAGMLQLEPRPFNLGKAAQDAAQIIAPSARLKGLDLQIDIASHLPVQLMGDAMRIKQIVINLLSNAVKFTSKGAIRLAITSQITEPGYHRISIVVTDTGIGLTEEQCGKIFDKYTQAHSFNSHQYGGTGLGLSICRALTFLMGGTIAVKSTIGIGSEFEVILELTDVTSTQ